MPLEALRGGDAAENAVIARACLAGETGPVRDAVLLNAAGAIAAFRGIDGGLEDVLAAGLEVAATAIDSGAAAELLEKWAAVTTRLGAEAQR